MDYAGDHAVIDLSIDEASAASSQMQALFNARDETWDLPYLLMVAYYHYIGAEQLSAAQKRNTLPHSHQPAGQNITRPFHPAAHSYSTNDLKKKLDEKAATPTQTQEINAWVEVKMTVLGSGDSVDKIALSPPLAQYALS